jgi:hypothetical protein
MAIKLCGLGHFVPVPGIFVGFVGPVQAEAHIQGAHDKTIHCGTAAAAARLLGSTW